MGCGLCAAFDEPRKVYEDDLVFAVVNWEPIKDGHVMVMPRRCAAQLSDMTPAESHAAMQLVDRLSEALRELYDDTPVVHVNCGDHRTEGHVHIHVIPSKGSLRHHFSSHEDVPYRVRESDEDLKAMADLIGSELS